METKKLKILVLANQGTNFNKKNKTKIFKGML